jgi:hypothetical protein
MRHLAAVMGMTACAAVFCGCAATQPTALVEKGASPYSIYHDPAAPASVKLAAEEIQRVIELSTGVKLPVVAQPATPMICLGDNAASRRAGLSADALPDEGYRLVTRGTDLYILGKDWPDADKKWDRCDSTGTLFGAYDFLERVVGVRWLMPGPLGEDVPRHDGRLALPALDVADAPAAPVRDLNCSPRRDPDVRVWQRRMRLGRSIAPSWGHNFALHPPTPVLLAHPEYMPLQADGAREKPIGNRAWGSYEHKFCLSNPGMVQAFADSLIASLEKNPRRFGESMAPADGGLWCVCPECRKLTLTDATGAWGDFPPYGRSVTPLVLGFYNGVGRAVAAKCPGRWVGGLAYHDYLYPPYEAVRVEPNVFIAIAVNSGYGYKFYKPETAGRLGRVIAEWARIAPNLGWTDYSTWMRNPCGAPLPPGLSILKTTFGAFGKSLKVINYQAQEAWGYGLAHNYVVAKLMWKTDADPDALYREALDRAYGPAAPAVDRIYALAEERLRAYVVAKPYPDHEIWFDTAEQVYAPIYPEIEQLYLKALTLARTDAQKRRLELLGDNLVMLHWNLRRAGLIKDAQNSPLYRDDESFDRFLAERKGSFAIIELPLYERYRWQTALWSPERRALEIKPLPAGVAAPAFDGALDDAAWRTAAVADAFRMNERRRDPALRQTTARVTYDREKLYLAFEVQEDEPAKLRKECAVPNSDSITKDDVVEFYLQPPGREPVLFFINAAGMTRVQGKGVLAAAARIGEKSWTVEAAVPFKALGLDGPPAGQTWRGNFARRRVGPPIEWSAWNRVEERLADERAFGEWRFAE